jgi:predicted permease
MNALIVFQRMLVLLAMMLTGFFCYKKGILDKSSCDHISKLAINVMNPLLILDGVIGKGGKTGEVVTQNLIMMTVYFVLLIALSFPVAKLLFVPKNEGYLYRLMLIFSNVGFMGIPVITSLYGEDCVLYIAFYILGYNVLLYTYGMYLVGCSVRAGNEAKPDGKSPGIKNLAKLLNSGVIACIIAIIIFGLKIDVPDPVSDFINILGQCCVPLSMILIGASTARQDFKMLLSDKKIYIFLALRMLVIPIAAAFLLKLVPFDRQVIGVFGLMLSMPVGSIVVLLASERGANEEVCTRGSVISTLLSVLTIPIIAAFLP